MNKYWVVLEIDSRYTYTTTAEVCISKKEAERVKSTLELAASDAGEDWLSYRIEEV